ncbi:DUF4352 domain-containing protein [Edaphobacter albus]|uniref:DUF4352 domain-containing protein n=1 Tax=Edaphobacter sp. 4G125 TaxID=2763071 RepID=UPI001648FA72|nr:DUF4352 domain-containing protein [Edaphobacter sp. 4G125]QNI37795.1 DUF4352 domain-containing protein [Edaphobacter sp. 4G125]
MRSGINWTELALWGLIGWTLIGLAGVTISFLRQERSKARRHLVWIGGIWLLYIAILLTISLSTKPRILAQGQEQCFGSLCFTVVRIESIPSSFANEGEQVLRVSIRITNHSHEQRKGDKTLQAYLVDSQGRVWNQGSGLEGVRLSTTVLPGDSVMSQPVFKIAKDATDLRLVLTHGHRLPYLLLLGDRDSLLHSPVYIRLEVQH